MDGINDHEIVADAALNYLSAGTTVFLGIQRCPLGLNVF
jgi:hypothetical protein